MFTLWRTNKAEEMIIRKKYKMIDGHFDFLGVEFNSHISIDWNDHRNFNNDAKYNSIFKFLNQMVVSHCFIQLKEWQVSWVARGRIS